MPKQARTHASTLLANTRRQHKAYLIPLLSQLPTAYFYLFDPHKPQALNISRTRARGGGREMKRKGGIEGASKSQDVHMRTCCMLLHR